MKKVIVIGAKGMLGQELVRIFQQDGQYEILAWDFAELDITDQGKVDLAMLKEMPDIVINAAAYNDVDGAEENEESYELAKQVNGFAPKYLAKAAKRRDAIFVQYSTDYVFDGKKDQYLENDLTDPISRYGKSKEMGEKNVLATGGKYYLVRISKLFGKPGVGLNAKKSFFEAMLKISENNDSFKVVDGERSCFTYAPDLAKATKELIEGNNNFGIYHLVNEGPATWFDGASKLFELAKKKISLIPVSSEEFARKAKRPDSSVLVNTKLPKLRHYEQALKQWLDNEQNDQEVEKN